MELDQKALEAAIIAGDKHWEGDKPSTGIYEAAIRAYLASLPSDDEVGRVCERLRSPLAISGEHRDEAAVLIQSQAAGLAAVNKALEDERRRATDAEYFNVAYRNMLGPVGRKVAEIWREKGVKRIHFDWGPDADSLSGEERAQFILDIEALPREPLDFDDGKGPRAARRAHSKDGGEHG